MNRLRLAIRVLVKGEAALQPPAPRPEHRAARPTEAERPREADPPAVSDRTRLLIALRDSVQAAAEDLDVPGSQALNAVARQLAQILASEQVVPIEDSGAFNARRHNAVASMNTDDRALDYQVASSVRPGYLASGTLFRRQDVIVYRFTGNRG
jgi:molecular chaperone GrpE (heat shock protein)